MREIKFRGWFKVQKKMVYNLGFDNDSFKNINDDIADIPCIWDKDCVKDTDNYEATFNFEIMQFTGLRDEKGEGQEIYQDDLCRDLRGNLYQIVWMEREAGWGACCLTDTGHHPECNPQRISYGLIIIQKLKVVGNIHQNPELLTKTL